MHDGKELVLQPVGVGKPRGDLNHQRQTLLLHRPERLTDHVEPARNDNGIGKADFSDRAKMRITLTFLRYFSARSA